MTDAQGNFVRVETKQFRQLVAACIAPALTLAATAIGYAWTQDTRMTKIETIGEALIKTVERQQSTIDDLKASAGTHQRFDQRMSDFERRMATIEAQQSQLTQAIERKP